MSVQPAMPSHLLTVAEYLELGETESGYTELDQGRLLMSPSPLFRHNNAAFELGVQLRSQLPRDLRIVLDLDLDLQLAPADGPGTVRRPDLMVVSAEATIRQRANGGIFVAADAILVVEIISPGSVRTDNILKRVEYADAGIPHYWIIEVDDAVTLLACHQAGEFGYADGGPVNGTFTATAPFPATVALDALV